MPLIGSLQIHSCQIGFLYTGNSCSISLPDTVISLMVLHPALLFSMTEWHGLRDKEVGQCSSAASGISHIQPCVRGPHGNDDHLFDDFTCLRTGRYLLVELRS